MNTIMRSAGFIALLRGINVTGRNKIAMPALCSLCAEIGWSEVQSYIQSGNLVFRSPLRASASVFAKLEAELEEAIERRFGLSIPVIARSAAGWSKYVGSNPFPDESDREPNLVMLTLSKAPPQKGALEGLRERAVNGERLIQAGDAIWVHYPSGAGKSKLSPALFDRLVGSPVTARNWRTVLRIEAMTRCIVNRTSAREFRTELTTEITEVTETGIGKRCLLCGGIALILFARLRVLRDLRGQISFDEVRSITLRHTFAAMSRLRLICSRFSPPMTSDDVAGWRIAKGIACSGAMRPAASGFLMSTPTPR